MATQPAIEADSLSDNILQRVGLFRPRPVALEAAGDHATSRAELRARRRLVNDIRSFLADHDLDVTPFTLRAAHEACCGLNPAFSRSIERQGEFGEPITVEWLEQAASEDPCSDNRTIEDLALALEQGIEELSRATKSMRLATSEYGDELERRVDGLNGASQTEEVIAQLADFAKAMLARSRQIEDELRESERETAALRKNLDRARRDAEVDFLTGLPNRRAFEEVLRDEHARARAAGEALSVAYCDIDRFKAINDSHGHEAGDRIIREVADTLVQQCGRDCYVARHGGEEFVLLSRGVEPVDAWAKLDIAREELASRRMINRRTDKPFGIVTFSGGIADVAQFADPREALAAADEALYRAKESGRNQICLARG
ncbi:diguanylate cyclase domain-containing protein [Alteriqipengyuania sp.]|uniref:GGDEF domain-containing protein n=1 Tax=Alteriqipengyuania sp. TaxID=2800692 RepID=UPI0035150963